MVTDRSRQVYDFVRAYTLRHGYAPKLREIAGHLGIRSRGRAAATRSLALPLLGRIAAGRPIEAIPGEDEIDLSEFFVNHNRFVLRAAGGSMIEDGILDGAMVGGEKRD